MREGRQTAEQNEKELHFQTISPVLDVSLKVKHTAKNNEHQNDIR